MLMDVSQNTLIPCYNKASGMIKNPHCSKTRSGQHYHIYMVLGEQLFLNQEMLNYRYLIHAVYLLHD